MALFRCRSCGESMTCLDALRCERYCAECVGDVLADTEERLTAAEQRAREAEARAERAERERDEARYYATRAGHAPGCKLAAALKEDG